MVEDVKDSVQYLGEDDVVVKLGARITHKDGNTRVFNSINKNWENILVNDWVVLDANGKFSVVKAADYGKKNAAPNKVVEQEVALDEKPVFSVDSLTKPKSWEKE